MDSTTTLGTNVDKQAMMIGLGVGFGSFIGAFILLCICWHFCCGKYCCEDGRKGRDSDDRVTGSALFSKIRAKKKSSKVGPKDEEDETSITTISNNKNSAKTSR